MAWLRQVKLTNRWYDPVFEFTDLLPENQGMVSAGTHFEDGRPRLFLHEVFRDREQEFIDYFKQIREHQ